MARPHMATLLSGPVDPSLQAALDRLVRVFDLTAAADAAGPWDAVLWHHGAPPPPGIPTAVWTTEVDLAAEPARSAAALLAPASMTDERCVVLGPYPEYPGARPVLPFSRRRIRRARRLAGPAVAEFDSGRWWWDGVEVADGAGAAAAGLAAAVVATEPASVLHALAWAAPTVTDPATAEAIGAVADTHLIVADAPAARCLLATELAADDRRAAAVSWAGRRLYERRWSAEGVLERLRGVSVDAVSADPVGRLTDAIDELRAPPDATVRSRSLDATLILRGRR